MKSAVTEMLIVKNENHFLKWRTKPITLDLSLAMYITQHNICSDHYMQHMFIIPVLRSSWTEFLKEVFTEVCR